VDTRVVIKKKLRIETRESFFQISSCLFFFSLRKKKNYKNKNLFFCRPTTVVDGSHNVSRWMTWLPISLKNAAKCDKWYQLQNLSITESLNANGTWKKALVVQLQVCRVLSVEQKPKNERFLKKLLLFFLSKSRFLLAWLD
jgi:hypothetical protein